MGRYRDWETQEGVSGREALEKRNTGRSGEGEDDGEVVVGVSQSRQVVDEGKIESEFCELDEVM